MLLTYYMQSLINLSEYLKPLDTFIEPNSFQLLQKVITYLGTCRLTLTLTLTLALTLDQIALGIILGGGGGIWGEKPTSTHICSPTERSLIALPTKLSGLGIPILAELASQEYCNSKELCAPLSEQIIKQEHEYVLNNESSTTEEKRANEMVQLKGASSWLTSLPLAEEKFALNKREFYDALYIRYRWHMIMLYHDA